MDEISAQYSLELIPKDLNTNADGTATEDSNDTADVDGLEGNDGDGDA